MAKASGDLPKAKVAKEEKVDEALVVMEGVPDCRSGELPLRENEKIWLRCTLATVMG